MLKPLWDGLADARVYGDDSQIVEHFGRITTERGQRPCCRRGQEEAVTPHVSVLVQRDAKPIAVWSMYADPPGPPGPARPPPGMLACYARYANRLEETTAQDSRGAPKMKPARTASAGPRKARVSIQLDTRAFGEVSYLTWTRHPQCTSRLDSRPQQRCCRGRFSSSVLARLHLPYAPSPRPLAQQRHRRERGNVQQGACSSTLLAAWSGP